MATKGGKSSSSNASGHHYDHRDPEAPLDDEELQSLYAWVDSIPLSRRKKNISRDFADGVLVAEIIRHCFPELVELHNYSAANAVAGRKENWDLLNRKVFPKMNFELAEDVINDLCSCKVGMIEKVLMMLQVKIKRAEYAKRRQSDKPEADQHQMTPGRKDGRMFRAGKEDTKGSGFLQTKQDIDIEPIKKVRFKDEKDKKGPRVEHFPPRQRNNRSFTGMETDVVPRIMLEEREAEVLAKDEMVKILQAKISRLEHLLHLKDMRIDDLQGRVESMRPTGIKK